MNRRKNSGGQAIILVTLALLAMCGMMGLAVDTGWSYFVHKQAQTAAADAAALAAVQEAYTHIAGGGVVVSGFKCANGPGLNVGCTNRGTAVGCSTTVRLWHQS